VEPSRPCAATNTMMFKWFKPSALDPLSVSMAGVKLGDRVLVLGSSDARLIAALSLKAGLTGRAVAVDESSDVAQAAERIALREGALIETASGPLTALPFEPGTFDLVVLRDVLRRLEPGARLGVAAEAQRMLRPGGRCMVIETVAASGLAGLFGGKGSSSTTGDETSTALQQTGFVAVRPLAEREGVLFVEAVKRGSNG
jgi:ubiquinone/menaquinone biosynthesis C-methylase UbiE